MFGARNNRTHYATIIVLYAIVGGLVSLSQLNYINADFVAYATIAKRTIETPENAVTAYWSSLFAWVMVPLLYFHIDELVAGRFVLLASGAIYLSAIYRLTVLHSYGDRHTHRLIQIGTMTCALVQAVIWANYLLAPDLLANAILYIYFCIVSPRRPTKYQPARGIVAGFVAGFAYLAKAYMLPFCCVHFAMSLFLSLSLNAPRSSFVKQAKSGFVTLGLFGLGLGLVAGPWIASLSQKCGRFTISTAGSSNHANMSPENFRKDPLWNPGLHANYIFEPGLTPDWSAFQDTNHFQHQLTIVWYNLLNCIGLIPVWLLAFAGCAAASMYWRVSMTREETYFLYWVAMTVSVYCGGYTLVNLEARYIIPTVVPLLCFGSLLMLRSILNHLSPFLLSSQADRSLPESREAYQPHFSELPHRQLARIRLSVGEEFTYLDPSPEQRGGSSRRAKVLAKATRVGHAVYQVSSADFSDTSLIDREAESSPEATIPPSQSHQPKHSPSLPTDPRPQDGFVPRGFGRVRPWPTYFAIGLVLILSGVDLHNLCRVTLRHPQASSIKQFHVVADHLHQLGITEAPTACSNLHFGLFVAYASNRLESYFGAPQSPSKSDLPGELADKGVTVFLQVRPETEIAALPSGDPLFEDDASWTKIATIRDQELLPNCLEVYVRR